MTTHKLHYTAESFFLCSHLPICVLDSNGQLLLSSGMSFRLSSFINEIDAQTNPEKMLLLLKASIQDLDNKGHYVYTYQEAIHFSLCLVNQTDVTQGIYLIGPYTSSLALNGTYLFKPPHCMASLIKLLYALGSEEQAPVLSMEQPEYSYHITKAKAYIEAHYHEMLTLDDLSTHLGLNKSYISALFKKSTNDTFCNYTNKVRVEKSKQLLAQTTQSILDIALSVGFGSGSYYNTIFKKLTGMTPLDYRNHYTNQPLAPPNSP